MKKNLSMMVSRDRLMTPTLKDGLRSLVKKEEEDLKES